MKLLSFTRYIGQKVVCVCLYYCVSGMEISFALLSQDPEVEYNLMPYFIPLFLENIFRRIIK